MFAIPFLLLILLWGPAALVLFWPTMRRSLGDGRGGMTWAAAGSVVTVLAAALLWLPLRTRVPLSLTLSNWPAPAQLPPLAWHIDELAWSLSGVLLLLTAAVLLVNLRQPDHGVIWSTLLLSGAGAMALWADSPAGLLWSWGLLAAVWAITLRVARPLPAHWLGRFGALLVSLLFIWLAAAALPAGEMAAGLALAGWPALATSWLLLAAAWQTGIFPLSLWRPVDWDLPAVTSVTIYTIPALAGAGLLARLAAGSDIGLRYSLPLTALGLLGLLTAIYKAWSYSGPHSSGQPSSGPHSSGPHNSGLYNSGQPKRVTTALLLAQASIILLVGTWVEGAAGAAAVVAETRVLILAGALLYLAGRIPAPAGFPLLSKLGSLWAVAALVGLPLTAGFSGRAALYNAWAADGRFLLLLIGVVLHILLIVAALPLVMNEAQPEEEAASPSPADWPLMAAWAGLALPFLGLVALPGSSWAGVAAVSWLAVLLPPAAAGALIYTVDPLPQIRSLLPHLVPGKAVWPRAAGRGRAAANALGAAVEQAGFILEGEKGLLWLLILVAIFWVAA